MALKQWQRLSYIQSQTRVCTCTVAHRSAPILIPYCIREVPTSMHFIAHARLHKTPTSMHFITHARLNKMPIGHALHCARKCTEKHFVMHRCFDKMPTSMHFITHARLNKMPTSMHFITHRQIPNAHAPATLACAPSRFQV